MHYALNIIILNAPINTTSPFSKILTSDYGDSYGDLVNRCQERHRGLKIEHYSIIFVNLVNKQNPFCQTTKQLAFVTEGS